MAFQRIMLDIKRSRGVAGWGTRVRIRVTHAFSEGRTFSIWNSLFGPECTVLSLNSGIQIALRYSSHAQVVNRAPQHYKIIVRTPYRKSLQIDWHVCDISWTLYRQILRSIHSDIQAFYYFYWTFEWSHLVKLNVNPFRPAEHAFTCVSPVLTECTNGQK